MVTFEIDVTRVTYPDIFYDNKSVLTGWEIFNRTTFSDRVSDLMILRKYLPQTLVIPRSQIPCIHNV